MRCVTDESSSDEEEEMNEVIKEVDTLKSIDNAVIEALNARAANDIEVICIRDTSLNIHTVETPASTEDNSQDQSGLDGSCIENLTDKTQLIGTNDSYVSSAGGSPNKSQATSCHKIVVSDNSSEETSGTTEQTAHVETSLSGSCTEKVGDDSGVSSSAESPEKNQETPSHELVVTDSPSRENGSKPLKGQAKNTDTDINKLVPCPSENTAAKSLSDKKATGICPNRGSKIFSICHCKR